MLLEDLSIYFLCLANWMEVKSIYLPMPLNMQIGIWILTAIYIVPKTEVLMTLKAQTQIQVCTTTAISAFVMIFFKAGVWVSQRENQPAVVQYLLLLLLQLLQYHPVVAPAAALVVLLFPHHPLCLPLEKQQQQQKAQPQQKHHWLAMQMHHHWSM